MQLIVCELIVDDRVPNAPSQQRSDKDVAIRRIAMLAIDVGLRRQTACEKGVYTLQKLFALI